MMNQLTQEKVDVLIRYLSDTICSSGDLIKEQVPLIAKDIITWQTTSAWLAISISVVSIIIFTLNVVMVQRYCKRHDISYNDSPLPCLSILAAIIVIVSGTFIIIFNVVNLVECNVAPRLVILDYLAHRLN